MRGLLYLGIVSGNSLFLQKLAGLILILREVEGQRITGYGLEGAALAAEGERLYVVLAARGGAEGPIFAEDALCASGDPLLPRWLDARIATVRRAIDGMESAEKRRDTFEQRRTLKRLLDMRKEL